MHVEEGAGEFVIRCSLEELEVLESGLYCYIDEYVGVCDEYVAVCQRLLTDIANMEC